MTTVTSTDNRAQRSKHGIVDCDIHPAMNDVSSLFPFMDRKWRDHIEVLGITLHQSFTGSLLYPRAHPGGLRRDAIPPSGGRQGSDVEFMRRQHLDPFNIRMGVLLPLPAEQCMQNHDLAAAYCGAMNEWQVHEWTRVEPRLKATVVVPVEAPQLAAREVARCAESRDFIQVGLPSRSRLPLGNKLYWPIYEAAARNNLPLCIHPNFGDTDVPLTPGGWSSYYVEEMTVYAQAMQAHLVSFLTNGVFEAFPSLRLAIVEGGFGWLPSLGWRLDKLWPRLKQETPMLKRLPSEYIRDHVWISSQPMEESSHPTYLRDTIEWIGWDRLMFSSDYPHWDTDDPAYLFPFALTEEQKYRFFTGNALTFYGMQDG